MQQHAVHGSEASEGFEISRDTMARPAGSLFRSSASLCATPVVLDLLDDFLGMARKEEAAGSMAILLSFRVR